MPYCGVDLEAGIVRGSIGNHVVVNGAGAHDRADLSRVRSAGAECADVADFAPGVDALIDGTHVDESNLTEAAFQEEGGFKTEEGIAVLESARIGVKLVFEVESNRRVVAQIFRALEAKREPDCMPVSMEKVSVASTPAKSASKCWDWKSVSTIP